MMSLCVVCGRSDAGRMKNYKGNWYCNGGVTGDNHNKCFSDKFSSKTTTVRRVQVRVVCPHCDTDVSDAWNTDADYDICPGCGAEFWESYEDCVHFIREMNLSELGENMISETRFPQAGIRGRDYAAIYHGTEIEDWFKRCLMEYPNLMAILDSDPIPGITRTFQALLIVNEWKVKWFSQFIEKGDKDES